MCFLLQTFESAGLFNMIDLHKILRGQFHIIGITPQYLKAELAFCSILSIIDNGIKSYCTWFATQNESTKAI